MSAVLPRAATLSKGPEMWGTNWRPATIIRGEGAYLCDANGGRWLDWVSGLGSNLLGHGDPDFADYVAGELWDGTGFSLPSYREQETAEKLVALLGAYVPGWSADPLSVRFGLSGSDACAMAVRLARAVTGRSLCLAVGYHGWHSDFVVATPPAHGIPDRLGKWVLAVPFGDGEALASWVAELSEKGDAPACVIIEQPPQEPPPDYWPTVQRLCREHGALLVLDEVVSGLRYALGGAAERFGIQPDIVCMGKALGNGVPVSAMVFRREYAEWFARRDPVFVSSTHFGCTLGLAAADYVLSHWTASDVAYLWHIGGQLIDGLRQIGYTVSGYPPHSLLVEPDPARRAYFVAGMRDRGILFNRPTFPVRVHTAADVERTLTAAREIWDEMQRVDVAAAMAGRLPEVLFANR